MNGEELFGVVVRTIGLGIAIFGLWHFGYGVSASAASTEQDDESAGHLGFGLAAITVGALLLFGAHQLVEWVY